MTFLGMGEAVKEKVSREKDDFYQTPRECTIALLRAEAQRMPHHIWEPACGDGALASVLEDAGFNVQSTDLVDRGYGIGGVDFLMEQRQRAPGIVTNPPFKFADEFIEHAYKLDVSYMALLLRVTFWAGNTRAELYHRWKPARVLTLGWRPDLFGIGTPDQRCLVMWCVWDKSAFNDKTEYEVLRRPPRRHPFRVDMLADERRAASHA